MLNWQRGKNRIVTKIIALVVVQAFLITNIGYTAPSDRSFFKNKKVDYKKIQGQREEALQQKKDTLSGKTKAGGSIYSRDKEDFTNRVKFSSLKDLSSIYIPDSLGRVVEVYQAPSGESRITNDERRLVVHIQDLHTNAEAQFNEASILEILIKDYGLGLVCSEGAEGEVDTSSVSSFPDPEVREKTARLFVDSGELTAEEYLSITKYPDLPIWGIEDKDVYFQNITEFNKIMKFSPDAQVFIQQAKEALERLRPEIYSKKLLEIDAKQAEYEEGELDTNEYLDYLLGLSKGIEIADKFKNISLLRESLEFEKAIDQQRIKEQSQRLLRTLQGILEEKQNRSEIQALATKAALFKDQKISPFSFYSYLDELARRHLKDDLERYQGLLDFVAYLEKVNSLDSMKLFQEIEELAYETKDLLSVNDNQKLLTRSLRHIKFLENFFNLKVSNEELDYYLANKESHKVNWFKNVITDLTPRQGSGQADYIDYNPDLIDMHLPELEHFYEIARERDIAMIDNAVSEIEKRNVKVATLIAGGFHTRGITQLLKEKGYSYVVISPYSSTDIDEENYQFLLSGERKPISELIGELNNQLRTMLLWTTRETVDAYNRDCVPALARILQKHEKELLLPYGAERMLPVLVSQILDLHRKSRPINIYSTFQGWPLERLFLPGVDLQILMNETEESLVFRYKEAGLYKYLKADARGTLDFVSEDEFEGISILHIREAGSVKEHPQWEGDPDYKVQKKKYYRSWRVAEEFLDVVPKALDEFTDIDLRSEIGDGEVLSVGFGDNASEILALAETFSQSKIIHAVDWIGDNVRRAGQELSEQPEDVRSRIRLYHEDAADLGSILADGSIKMIFIDNVLVPENYENDPDKIGLIIDELSRVLAKGGYIVALPTIKADSPLIQKFRDLGFEIISEGFYQREEARHYSVYGLIVRKPLKRLASNANIKSSSQDVPDTIEDTAFPRQRISPKDIDRVRRDL